LILDILRNIKLREVLAGHYRRGVASAVKNYQDSAADEDSVTGALGQAISGDGAFVVDGKLIGWKTRYRKLRGRGPGAPEKRTGADGVFEIELEDDAGIRSRKTLPFQAKNDASSYGDSDLREQAKQLTDLPGSGIVINYRADGYVVVPAEAVAKGTATKKIERPLEESLGGDFLECTTGSAAYIFDPTRQEFLQPSGSILLRRHWAPGHRIRTSLKIR
jgi:hypothetical protein